ncbi:hypothetical protein [Psychrosphaera aestuarii]|uniref:hypothetical protein n=1 Tax=Psychrosphaera aestuarii TaxID=1266052 RepID=UPI001B3341A5|nr:hypothetical protein [Psychrosphaera aestuarii]
MTYSDPAILGFYLAVILQVVITTVLIPINVKGQFSQYLLSFSEEAYPQLYTASSEVIKKYLSYYLTLSFVISLSSFYLIYLSISNQQELFNWDNQSGIIVLFVMSLLPFFFLIFINKKFFQLLKDFSSNKRSASLTHRRWQDFISTPSIILLGLGHLLFITVNSYFQQFPFQGYAGYTNYLGLLFLDTVNVITIALIVRGKNLAQLKSEHKKRLFQAKAINVNVTIWIIAVYYITMTLILAGAELRDFSLIMQSVYFIFVYIMVNRLFVGENKPNDNKNTSS